MSHQPERKEKDCLNCGTEVAGRYCQTCGQENMVAHQTFWSLTKHFVFDIFHFDGKFFDTVRYLLFRPGFVAMEYVKGRRTRYLDPIRMYLFTSALFFLVFFAAKGSKLGLSDTDGPLSKAERMELAMELSGEVNKDAADTALAHKLALVLDSTQVIRLTDSVAHPSAAVQYKGKQYGFSAQYDSSGIKTKKEVEGNWIEQQISKTDHRFKAKYGDDTKAGLNELIEKFLHRIPYLLFLSLPFFALILKLLYRRKNVYYSDHAVFTLYHYIFSFLILLLYMAFQGLYKWSHLGVFNFINDLLVTWWAVYLFLGLKNFYGLGWRKTLAKFLLLNFMGFVCLILLFLVFIIFSLSQI